MSQSSTFSVFRNRTFSLLWIAEFISSMGGALTSLAASLLVYRLTNSALSVGLMLIATAAPSLLVGLMAGVFVDRWDRKKIMLIADLVRGALVLAIPFLVSQSIVWLYVIVALTSVVNQFFEPAHESVLPDIVEEKDLNAVTSLTEISSFGSTALGFAAAGIIAASATLDWAFYFDGITFFVSALCIFFIRIPRQETTEESTSVTVVTENLKIGLKHILKTDTLRSLFFVYVFVFILLGQWNSMQLPFYIRAMGATEFDYGILEMVGAIGFAISSLALIKFGGRLQEGQWITISFAGMALSCLIFSVSTSIPLALFMFGLQGLLNAPAVIARRLIIQRNTPRALRGRVASAFFVSRDTVWIFGMALAALADYYDVRWLLIINSLLFLAVAFVSGFMPGLYQPIAEWKRTMSLLRGDKAAPRLGMGRAATLADFDFLSTFVPAWSTLSVKEKRDLASQSLVTDAPGGTVVVARGEVSDAAYFVISGLVVAGYLEEGEYRILSTMKPGDFFGEIAALKRIPRTADIITDEDTSLLQIPAQSLLKLLENEEMKTTVTTKMSQRMESLHAFDAPFFGGLAQDVLRELRTVEMPKPNIDKSKIAK